MMALVPVPDGDSQGDSAMAAATPASLTLKGIPAEVKNQIYSLLVTNSRDVSVRKFIKLREQSRGAPSWEQFRSSIVVYPLTMTCRQMRTEFGSILAATPIRRYCFVVNNLDPNQLALFREFTRRYCPTDTDWMPPILRGYQVVLCLKLDSKIFSSVEAYLREARVQARNGGPRSLWEDYSEIESRLIPSSGVCGTSTSNSKSMTQAQAELARSAVRSIRNINEICGLYMLDEPEREAINLLLVHLTSLANNLD